jgi:hypothetical protein
LFGLPKGKPRKKGEEAKKHNSEVGWFGLISKQEVLGIISYFSLKGHGSQTDINTARRSHKPLFCFFKISKAGKRKLRNTK